MRVKRFVILSLLPGVITILCHANAYAPDNRGGISLIPLELVRPSARDDSGNTMEESPLTINVLLNDRDNSGDDDEDDDDAIDPSTVDLNPPTNDIDNNIVTPEGNYSVNAVGDVTYLPALNFAGGTSIRYTVNDNRGRRSNDATLNITVTNIDDAPVITGQNPNPVAINEDQPLAISFNHLLVTDPDNNYPEDFTLQVSAGANYSVSGNTITPSAEFTGMLSIPVTVDDGTASSNAYNLQVLVSAVNDIPEITGQNPVSTIEEEPITISLNHLIVTDPDDAYPADFTLSVLPGTNYSVSGNTITPALNFAGTLSAGVMVNDGSDNSNLFNLQITVTDVNDAPVITGQNPDPISMMEDQSLTILFSHLLVTDPDQSYPSGFTLTVSEGTNYTLSGSTITPTQDFSGTLSVPVLVNDGALNSNTFIVQVSVSDQNDIPAITGHVPLTIEEDNSLRVTLTELTVTDGDNNYPADFTLTLSPGTNYTLSGTTLTPSPDYAGPLTVPAIVNDGTNDSAPYDLAIAVNPVNDVPLITGQSDISTNENQPVTLTLSQLTVTDSDNAYPSGFTLSVLPGANYTVSGTTVTPAPGFNGSLIVDVSVNDGQANSGVFNLLVTVNAINDPPLITGQNALNVDEDNSITIQFSDIMVTDPDNSYPTGFSMVVQPGTNYTVSGSTVIPALDFAGTLTVGVYVNDGTSNSAPFNLSIAVNPVNDAAVITGQLPLSTNEDQPLSIALTHLLVSDPDNSFPSGFTLAISPGSNYSVTASTVTPDTDFQGVLTIPVQINDGLLNSNIFNLSVSVTELNDPPIITGQTPVATAEDTPVAITLSHLIVLDTDDDFPSGFTLIVSSGANYSVSGNTVTPAQDFTGTLNISVSVNDGTSDSQPFIFQVQVGDSNDPPHITAQVPLSTNEEQPITILLSHLTVTDPDNPYPTGFTLLVAPGNDYAVSGNTVTPALNFTGTLIVPVRVNDGLNNSASFDLQLLVNQINDAPSFDAIANIKIPENAVPGKVTITGISKGPGEESQQLTFVVTSGNSDVVPHPTISYNGTSASATLSYSVVANKSGIVTISAVAIDNGSNVAPHTNTYAGTFQIEISEINLAPTLDAIANVSVQEDAPLQGITLSGITSGPGESQTLSVEASTNKPELFETLQINYTSPAVSGTLQVKPIANSFGTAQVTIKVTDNGSAIQPSVNFFSRVFTVTIQPVNDPPVFLSIPIAVAAINELYTYDIEISDVENATVSITAPEKPSWATLTNTGSGRARLSGTPPASSTGVSTVRIAARDGDVTVEQQYTLVVNTRPAVSSFAVSTAEDGAVTFQANQFSSAYTDVNQHVLAAIQITGMPVSGALLLSGQQVKPNDTIAVSSLGALVYKPDANYAGNDSFQWKASDGYHFSAAAAGVNISITPVNDVPVITLEDDSLHYEVNGEPAALTALLEITDADDDSLSQAQLTFHKQTFAPEYDMLLFQDTPNIKGFFDYQNGMLSLTGHAPLKEYQEAIRSIQYNHLNTLDPRLQLKTISIAVHDGELFSDAKDRWISLQYTFIELEIPTGFTPNGDNANDKWVITRPGGIEQLQQAIIRVVNKRGVMVYQSLGFDHPWDGTMDGEVLPADTYYFSIDLKLKSKKTYKGIITILR